MIEVYSARPEDALELDLREEDLQEVSEGWRERLEATIPLGLSWAFRSPTGALLGLGGFIGDASTVSPWLLCSKGVADHKASAWRLAKEAVRVMRAGANGRLIYNFIPKAAVSNRRFILALGFVILPSPRDGFDFFYLPCANPQPS